jgi:hypothetical protein
MNTLPKQLPTALSLAALLLLATVGVQAQNALTNGLVAYYPFNGNAKDASGHGNDGIVTNAVLTQDRCGMPASAYDFVSVDCQITSSFQGVVGSNPRTVSCWIKQKDDLRTKTEEVINWGLGGACAGQFSCGFNADANFGADSFYFGVSIDVGCGRIVYDQGPWDGRWHHYAWVVPDVQNPSLTDVKVFEDGSLLTTGLWYYRGAAYCSTVFLDSTPEAMAIPRGGTPNGFGSIDDLRVYNRALSDQEVAELYKLESSPQPCTTHRATATAQVVNGFIVGITITDPGCGYTNTSPPAVIFRDSTGTGAAATAIVTNGIVERIQIDSNGRDYTDSVRVLIAPPPFLPTLTIGVSRVNVTVSVVLGRRYQLESSANLATWSPIGDPFVAQDDTVTQEFVVQDTGRYFRINEVP